MVVKERQELRHEIRASETYTIHAIIVGVHSPLSMSMTGPRAFSATDQRVS
jgi:hypothetical protein